MLILEENELWDEGEVVPGFGLVRTTLNGVAKPWDVFVEAIVAKENLPSWGKLWDDFVREETRRGLVQGSSSTSRECCPPISTRWQLHVHEDVHNCTNYTLEKFEDFSLLQGNCPFVKRNVRSPVWEN